MQLVTQGETRLRSLSVETTYYIRRPLDVLQVALHIRLNDKKPDIAILGVVAYF